MGKLKIPPEAMEEYEFSEDEKIILISGSKRSGGLSLNKLEKIKKSPLSSVLKRNPELEKFEIPKGQLIKEKNRFYCWTSVEEGGFLFLPIGILNELKLEHGDLLLAARGSHLGLSFLSKGPIINEANNHPELQVFE